MNLCTVQTCLQTVKLHIRQNYIKPTCIHLYYLFISRINLIFAFSDERKNLHCLYINGLLSISTLIGYVDYDTKADDETKSHIGRMKSLKRNEISFTDSNQFESKLIFIKMMLYSLWLLT